MFTSHFYTFISQNRSSPKNTLLCLNTRHWSKGQCNSSLSDATYAYNFSPYLLPCLFYFNFLFRFVPMKCDVSADTLRGQTKGVNPTSFFWTSLLFSIRQTTVNEQPTVAVGLSVDAHSNWMAHSDLIPVSFWTVINFSTTSTHQSLPKRSRYAYTHSSFPLTILYINKYKRQKTNIQNSTKIRLCPLLKLYWNTKREWLQAIWLNEINQNETNQTHIIQTRWEYC